MPNKNETTQTTFNNLPEEQINELAVLYKTAIDVLHDNTLRDACINAIQKNSYADPADIFAKNAQLGKYNDLSDKAYYDLLCYAEQMSNKFSEKISALSFYQFPQYEYKHLNDQLLDAVQELDELLTICQTEKCITQLESIANKSTSP